MFAYYIITSSMESVLLGYSLQHIRPDTFISLAQLTLAPNTCFGLSCGIAATKAARWPSLFYKSPVILLQVVFLSMLGRSMNDEMGRIAERGSQHAAAAWLRIANHAEQAEQQLHARQQARVMHVALNAIFDDDDCRSKGHNSAHDTLAQLDDELACHLSRVAVENMIPKHGSFCTASFCLRHYKFFCGLSIPKQHMHEACCSNS